jgi:hypothetical protein
MIQMPSKNQPGHHHGRPRLTHSIWTPRTSVPTDRESRETRKQWWNGHWGRIVRKDVLIHVDGDAWLVEARDGGAEGRSRFLDAENEDAAVEIARDLMIGSDGWQELTAS